MIRWFHAALTLRAGLENVICALVEFVKTGALHGSAWQQRRGVRFKLPQEAATDRQGGACTSVPNAAIAAWPGQGPHRLATSPHSTQRP